MATAREVILGAVAKAIGSRTGDNASIAREACALLEGARAAAIAGRDRQFRRSRTGPKVGATLHRVSSLTELPVAVAQFLAAKGLDPRICVQPAQALGDLDWSSAGIEHAMALDDGVAVGLARWGIAETGSLVFHSAADMPILFNFLPAVHIVAIHAGVIVPYLEDYAAAARAAGDAAPRNVCLITGASGTTDIEGSLVKGAHGPRELHVIVVGAAPPLG